MKKLLIGLLAMLALDSPVTAQQQTLPASTVVGRLGIGPGPAQAIPFSTLSSVLVGATINVMNFGCAGNGVADDQPCIQSAINQLPATGGDVNFPCGTYKLGSTVSIGNGSGAAASTRYGVHLRGAGSPIYPVFTGLPTTPCVKFTWSGGAASMLNIMGPLQAWGLHNLYFDCGGVATIGINVVSAAFGDNSDLTVWECRTAGIYNQTVPPPGGVLNADNLHNYWRNTFIRLPEVNNANGLILTGGTTSNTDYNVFINTVIELAGTATGTVGLVLQACDSNMFYGLHFFAGNASAFTIVFDYSILNVWPASNGFYGVDPKITAGTLYANVGSPGGGAAPNWIYGLVTTNGATPPALANLSYILPGVSLAGVIDKTLTVNNSLTLAGTDATVMTFPATSTTVAGLGIAQTFTALQTITRSVSSGVGGLSIGITQTAPNAGDTNDGVMLLTYNLSAASATNELVARVFKLQSSNNLTGGGLLSNARIFNLLHVNNASTTTTSLDGIYIESTAGGTVTTGAAIRIASWLGTTKWGIADDSGGNWYNATGGLSLGAVASAGSGVLLATSYVKTGVTTVGALPTCNAGTEGARHYVTDQNTVVAYRGATTGGGATRQAVLCSNSAWIQD